MDTGIGVPESKRQEIFEEFVQADSSHGRKFEGTGLGLAISRRLVAAMGGQIGLEPAPDGGSIFWFTIPANGALEPPHYASALAGKRVAVLSRNAVLREGVLAQLQSAGAVMTPLTEEGLRSADVMLVDAGTEAEPAPIAPPVPSIPAFLMLSQAARAAAADVKAEGFAGYLIKPVRQTTLVTWLSGRQPQAEALPQIAEHTHTAGAGCHVLLVEDNPINALLTKELLRRRGHSFVVVTSGEDAVKAMEAGGFDLILTDIHMPGMGGIAATKAIRDRETEIGRERTPIIALTADVLETGRRACREAGMDGFLTKPVEPTQLDDMFAAFFPERYADKARDRSSATRSVA
jgi:CheY-like chemotaxis protein